MCLLFLIANVEFPIQVAKTGCGGIRPGVKLKTKAFFLRNIWAFLTFSVPISKLFVFFLEEFVLQRNDILLEVAFLHSIDL